MLASRSLLLGIVLVAALATSVVAKPVDEQALHALLVERVAEKGKQ